MIVERKIKEAILMILVASASNTKGNNTFYSYDWRINPLSEEIKNIGNAIEPELKPRFISLLNSMEQWSKTKRPKITSDPQINRIFAKQLREFLLTSEHGQEHFQVLNDFSKNKHFEKFQANLKTEIDKNFGSNRENKTQQISHDNNIEAIIEKYAIFKDEADIDTIPASSYTHTKNESGAVVLYNNQGIDSDLKEFAENLTNHLISKFGFSLETEDLFIPMPDDETIEKENRKHPNVSDMENFFLNKVALTEKKASEIQAHFDSGCVRCNRQRDLYIKEYHST